MTLIHPLAVVDPQAVLGSDVRIGPFCVVEADVEIGDGCTLASHVVVKSGTTLGAENRVFDGAVLGGLPQHARMPEHPGRLIIGAGNVIREHCTLHRALHADQATRVGDQNLLMVGVHIAHDCQVGNQTIFANGALLAGHVAVADRAYLSGGVGVHQFCRVGSLAMVGGHARVVQDVPPYMMVDGTTGCIVGLNLVGLRRAGFLADEIAELKAAYRVIYRSGLLWRDKLAELARQFSDGPAALLGQFLAQGSRGFVQERRMPPTATLKIRAADDDEPGALRAKAG
jgi:UDP-N-acetylglucosamine acyltransferase